MPLPPDLGFVACWIKWSQVTLWFAERGRPMWSMPSSSMTTNGAAGHIRYALLTLTVEPGDLLNKEEEVEGGEG